MSCGGACTGNETCGGGGTPNVCGCTPRTCESVGASGGTIDDGCGGTTSCVKKCHLFFDECGPGEFCDLDECRPKLGFEHACRTTRDCESGCCCGAGAISCDIPLRGGTPGVCDSFSLCERGFGAPECAGGPCGQDSDCHSDSLFCTSGVCTAKALINAPCSFSAGCITSCCCPQASGEARCADSCPAGCNP